MQRRKFLHNLGLLTSSFAFDISGISVNASPLTTYAAKQLVDDKILVIIQLFGGNDGLNTIIPYENDIYHKARPTLRIKKENVLKINDSLGFHPKMNSFYNLFNEGKISIVQNVGYENPDRSHFRSTDIWKSASDSKEYIYSGWGARYLNSRYPGYFEELNYPLMVELGWGGSLLTEINNSSLGIFLNSPEEYYSIEKDNNVDPFNQISLKAKETLDYINNVALQSKKYSSIIKETAVKGKTTLIYPDTFLGKQLSIVSKLISGDLKTPVYLTKLKGFDTHFNQLGTHDELLEQVSNAVGAFQKDLQTQNLSDKVTVLVFSEFGRRVTENSTGTDHGAAAPIFVVGNSVRGGLIGKDPDLKNLDKNGDIIYKLDYRQVYSTILKDHLNVSDLVLKDTLLHEYNTLPIYNNSIEPFPAEDLIVEQNFPNPVKDFTTIKYFISSAGRIQIDLLDLHGKVIKNLYDHHQLSGYHKVNFDCSDLYSALYFYRFRQGSTSIIKKLIISK